MHKNPLIALLVDATEKKEVVKIFDHLYITFSGQGCLG